jgi:PIN domain nuclease of toxin-antitoxin system
MLIDTHVWIWWLTAAGNLSSSERQGLNASAAIEPLRISAISLWEAQMLHARRRFALDVPFEPWLLQATLADIIRVLPIDTSVILELNRMPPMHDDPADRLIAATARAHDLPLATHDRRIRKSGLVRIWRPDTVE